MDEYRIFPVLIVFMICTLAALAYALRELGASEHSIGEPRDVRCVACGQMQLTGMCHCIHCGVPYASDALPNSREAATPPEPTLRLTADNSLFVHRATPSDLTQRFTDNDPSSTHLRF